MHVVESLTAGFFLSYVYIFIGEVISFGRGWLNFEVSVAVVVLLVLGGFFFVRGVAFAAFNREGAPKGPPGYEDWQKSRNWSMLIMLTILLVTIFLIIQKFLWNEQNFATNQRSQIIFLTGFLISLALYLYSLHKLGLRTYPQED